METTASAGLADLVQVVCEIEGRRGMTPVLVSDRRLVLSDEFYVELCEVVLQRSSRAVRLDLLPGHPLACHGGRFPASGRPTTGPWLPASAASAIFRPMRPMFLRRLAKRLPQRASIESTAAVARPGGSLRELVIGLAGPGDELPSFAQELALGIELAGALS